MLTEQTIDKLQAMNLHGMAEALDRQRSDGKHVSLSFEERMGLLVDHEWTQREQRKLDRRLKQAKLRHDAALEDVDYTPGRGLDRQVVLSLGSCSWIAEHQNVIVSGSTGTGKSYLACALAERALRQEEERFAETLSTGMGLLAAAIAKVGGGTVIDGETVFKLYDTYGFPIDLTNDVAR